MKKTKKEKKERIEATQQLKPCSLLLPEPSAAIVLGLRQLSCCCWEPEKYASCPRWITKVLVKCQLKNPPHALLYVETSSTCYQTSCFCSSWCWWSCSQPCYLIKQDKLSMLPPCKNKYSHPIYIQICAA